MSATGYERALDAITRVRGVRGSMLVSVDDGIMVADLLLEGIKGGAVAALAASLGRRLQSALQTAGAGSSVFWHLQCDQGALLAVPAGANLVVVAITDPDVNVGLVRLELLRAAETMR